jgi:hypothetical protein
MTVRPQQQQQQQRQPSRVGGTGRSPQRDHLADMLSNLSSSRGMPSVTQMLLNRAGNGSAASAAGRSSRTAGRTGTSSSSSNTGRSVPGGAQAAAAAAAGAGLVSFAGAPVPVLLSQQANGLPLMVSAALQLFPSSRRITVCCMSL